MRNSTTWFPDLRSWINAIALFIIFFGLQYATYPLFMLVEWIAPFWPKILSVVYIILLTGPIVAIALIHHWFHKLLDQFVPDTRVVEVDGKPTVFPNIFSWWQGIYGLFIGVFSYLITSAMIGLIFSSGDMMTIIQSQITRPNPIIISPIQIGQFLIRIICIAYFYHIEFLVQQQFINSSRR